MQDGVNAAECIDFPDNLQVQFIDNKTGAPAVTSKIVSQNPARP
jgi:hypothetical protein